MTQEFGITETTIGPTMGAAVMGVGDCREIIEALVYRTYEYGQDFEPAMEGANGWWAIHFSLNGKKYSWACHSFDGKVFTEVATIKDGAWEPIAPTLTALDAPVTVRSFFHYIVDVLAPIVDDDQADVSLETLAKTALFAWLTGGLPRGWGFREFRRQEPFCPWAVKVIGAVADILGEDDRSCAGYTLMWRNIDPYEPDQMEGFFQTVEDAVKAFYYKCGSDDKQAASYFRGREYFIARLYWQDPEAYREDERYDRRFPAWVLPVHPY